MFQVISVGRSVIPVCMLFYSKWATSWGNLFVPYANNKAQISSTCFSRNFKTLASLYSWAGQFESYLLANPRRQVFSWCGSNNIVTSSNKISIFNVSSFLGWKCHQPSSLFICEAPEGGEVVRQPQGGSEVCQSHPPRTRAHPGGRGQGRTVDFYACIPM